ncbi:hypothetical protein T492DRAFT_838654 [Pavlovales sp. CCMP2436]|nr:hypothetical protein T492DRAFT_838654 [Pavlovales sp. CCMP2436]
MLSPTAAGFVPAAARQLQQAVEFEYDRMPRGQRVIVHGLSGRADLNDFAAEVQHWDPMQGRYEILVLLTGDTVRVKPENLTAVDEPSYDDEEEPSWREIRKSRKRGQMSDQI